MFKKYKKNLDFPESYISMGLGLLVVIVVGMLLFNFFRSNKNPNNQSASTAINEDVNVSPTPQMEPVNNVPAKHTVQQGESLWSIAEIYYHSGYNWVTLASENNINNPNSIYIGQELSIPKAEVIIPGQFVSNTNSREKIESSTYTIVKGDDLWNIAVRTYGDGYAWVKIANENQLANPNLIHVGNILKLPR